MRVPLLLALLLATPVALAEDPAPAAPDATTTTTTTPTATTGPVDPASDEAAPPASTTPETTTPEATTPEATPGPSPLTTTITTTTTTTTTPPPAWRDDARADLAYNACARLSETGTADLEAARACYRDVIAQHPGTLAALRAETAVFVLGTPLVVRGGDEAFNIPAGRLGITTAAGAFGLWNAIAGGVLLGFNIPDVNGTALIAGTGVVGVAAGLGFGYGGYVLAEKLQLDEGAARLVASSLVWGSVLGTSVAPAIAFSDTNGLAGFNLSLATVVGAGYLAGGAALLLTSMVSFDEAQVSMINSGGAIGATLGLLALPHLSAAGVSDVAPYSLAFAGATTVGLVGGGLLGRSLALTWGEALLCDLGAVLGIFAGGTAVLVAGLPSLAFATAVPAIGLVGGYTGGLLFVGQWRASRGAPIWRDGPDVRPVVTSLFTGREQVPAVGVSGSF